MTVKACRALFACLILACLTAFGVRAQSLTSLLVEAHYRNADLPSVFADLEARYALRFFYPPAELPGIPVNAVFESMPLPAALDRLLEGSRLGYLFYRDYAVIVADRQVLARDFQVEYYQALERQIARVETDDFAEQTIAIGDIRSLDPSGQALVRGLVVDEQNGEPVLGATIMAVEAGLGAASDEAGRFELRLPTGAQQLKVQFIGFEEQHLRVEVFGDGQLPITLRKEAVNLQEVIVQARAPDANVSSVQAGVMRMEVQSMRKLPAFLGEVDVVRSLLLQPGVSTIGEGALGFNVRGGEVDQNLIMQDDAFLFNSAHALGFFSTFNTDLIQGVTLYKGAMPAQYGGRLASALDVEMRNGDTQRYALKGGVGVAAARLSAEGPVIRDRGSFIAGLRATYSDWILRLAKTPELQSSSVAFHDFNLRYSHRLSENHRLTLSGYSSSDAFQFGDDFRFEYQTLMGQAAYRAILGRGLYSNLSATYSRYRSAQFDLEQSRASRFQNSVSYVQLKELLTALSADERLKVDAGFSGILYLLEPGAIGPTSPWSFVAPKRLEEEQGLESAVFANAEWSPSAAFSVSAGLRLVDYRYLGPKALLAYDNEAELPNLEQVVDTLRFGPWRSIARYGSLEPRLSARYRFSSSASLKFGYSRVAQFINLLANTDAPSPASIWQLSTPYIAPQRAHNLSLGWFQNFDNNRWETSIEPFYRIIDELFDYRDFAQLVVNEHLETELLPGRGRAYGLELSVRRAQGRLNGWLSYTYSRSLRQTPGISLGAWYPANFDKPHDVSLVLNYAVTGRNMLSINFNYSTGRPVTAPVGVYALPSRLNVPVFSQRNQLRIPDYHRLDIAYTFGQSYNRAKRFKTSWTASIYNVYARRNAYSVFFTRRFFQQPTANRLTVLGSAFPSLTFNFEWL
jgi:hypothetical protein